MTRPDDIPDDVWNHALELWRDDERDDGPTIIGRAILAERGRCMAIVESDFHKARGYALVADAIREGDRHPQFWGESSGGNFPLIRAAWARYRRAWHMIRAHRFAQKAAASLAKNGEYGAASAVLKGVLLAGERRADD